jgi:hypothetical protein
MTALTGPELLNRFTELRKEGLPKGELAQACGYVTPKGDGKNRVNFTSFYEALLEAKGFAIGNTAVKVKGKQPSGLTHVHFNGNLMVGKTYVARMGLKPGDELQIKFTKSGICLIPTSVADSADAVDAVVTEEKEPVSLPLVTNLLSSLLS